MKILVGFIQFASMVLHDVAKVALQTGQMLKDGTVQEVGADEGVSFVHSRSASIAEQDVGQGRQEAGNGG